MFKNITAAYIPKHGKGEDAHFVSANTLGVADGVGEFMRCFFLKLTIVTSGGWVNVGVDAGIYARELMRQCELFAAQESDPRRILQAAFERMGDLQGTTTACIVRLSGNVLTAANLGDSGFMLIRDGKMVKRSKEQQRYW